MIEKYTRQIKTHRNVADIEKAFIAKAWREAIGMVDDWGLLFVEKIILVVLWWWPDMPLYVRRKNTT